MNTGRFFLTASCVGIMLLNNTAVAHADWASGTGTSSYSGQITMSSASEHNLADFTDFRRSDGSELGGDSLFGSTSIQSPVTLVSAGANIEMLILTAGEPIDNQLVNNKECPAGTTFNAFVTPVATCSSHFGSNFSGFRAQAERIGDADSKKWKPMLYMNAKGRWIDLGKAGSPNTPSVDVDGLGSGLTGPAATSKDMCAQVLVQKICQ